MPTVHSLDEARTPLQREAWKRTTQAGHKSLVMRAKEILAFVKEHPGCTDEEVRSALGFGVGAFFRLGGVRGMIAVHRHPTKAQTYTYTGKIIG